MERGATMGFRSPGNRVVSQAGFKSIEERAFQAEKSSRQK